MLFRARAVCTDGINAFGERIRRRDLQGHLGDNHVSAIRVWFEQLVGAKLSTRCGDAPRQTIEPDIDRALKSGFSNQMNFDLSDAAWRDGEILRRREQLKARALVAK